ncbi:MAG TPA: sialidase family protein [Candidatus Lokiarchaeia archaeon]|nr:sialidase family protein [Candidatus Lokiarchaeia archaeon]
MNGNRNPNPELDTVFHSEPPRWIAQGYLFQIGTVLGCANNHAGEMIAGACHDGIQELHVVWFAGTVEGHVDTKIMHSRIRYDVESALKCSIIEQGDPFEPHNNDLFAYSEPRAIAGISERSSGNAVPFIDTRGRFHLWFASYYTKGSNVPEGEDPRRRDIFYQYSDDDGETWTEPSIWSDRPGSWVRNALLVLDDGTWLLPINDEITYLPEFDCNWSSRFAFSHDDGITWEFSDLYSVHKFPGAARGGMIQPTVVQLADGSLYCLNRSHTGWIVEMRSFDRGATWTTPVNTSLPNPQSAICMIRRQNGDLLLAYNPSQKNRYPISIARSRDDGMTWQRLFDLRDENGELSYPSLVESPDGLVHCTYTLHWRTIAHDAFFLD